jgi:hypothetical protein
MRFPPRSKHQIWKQLRICIGGHIVDLYCIDDIEYFISKPPKPELYLCLWTRRMTCTASPGPLHERHSPLLHITCI